MNETFEEFNVDKILRISILSKTNKKKKNKKKNRIKSDPKTTRDGDKNNGKKQNQNQFCKCDEKNFLRTHTPDFIISQQYCLMTTF